VILYQLQIIDQPRPSRRDRILTGPITGYGRRLYALEYQGFYFEAVPTAPANGGGTIYRRLGVQPLLNYVESTTGNVQMRGFERLFIGLIVYGRLERFVFGGLIGYSIHIDTATYLYRPGLHH